MANNEADPIDAHLDDKIATPKQARRRGLTVLRDRTREGHARVGFLELFYDLVFVFAVTQLSHRLLADVAPVNALETFFLFAATWWAWMYTTWAMNWLDPDNLAVRLMVFVLIGLGLVMSMAIPQAYGARGLAFGLAYIATQILRSLFMVWAMGSSNQGHNFRRLLIWFVISAPFWIGGGLVEGPARWGLWLAALALDLIGPIMRYWLPGFGASKTRDWNIEGDHMAERCGLFMIIALGESLLVTGATFAGLEWTPVNWAALAAVVLGTFAMWWAYFDTGVERGAHFIAHSDDPGAIGRRVYTYYHAIIVAGIIVTAVGDELTLAHPIGHLEAKFTATAVGGPALYLLGNLLFKHEIAGLPPFSHLVGLALLAIGAVTAHVLHLEPLHLAAWATFALIVTAIWENISLSRGRPEDSARAAKDAAAG